MIVALMEPGKDRVLREKGVVNHVKICRVIHLALTNGFLFVCFFVLAQSDNYGP